MSIFLSTSYSLKKQLVLRFTTEWAGKRSTRLPPTSAWPSNTRASSSPSLINTSSSSVLKTRIHYPDGLWAYASQRYLFFPLTKNAFYKCHYHSLFFFFYFFFCSPRQNKPHGQLSYTLYCCRCLVTLFTTPELT